MGAEKNYNGQGNIFSTAPKDTTMDAETSRLATNANSYRNALLARNLYSPTVTYPLPPDEVSNVVNSIDSVLDVLTPFKSFDLNNTVIGRAISNKTPLTTIGLALLGKQFAYNEMSHIAQQTFPVINVNNLFDSNKNTKLFTIPENYSITKKTAPTGFVDFLEKMTSTYPSYNRPFNKFSSSNDYLKNTGEGQQNLLLSSLNRNIYKEKNTVLNAIGEAAGNPVQPRSWVIEGNFSTYYNFSQSPYLSIHTNPDSERAANDAMKKSYIDTSIGVFGDSQTRVSISDGTQEYAPTTYYIKSNFGTTKNSKAFRLVDLNVPIASSTDKYLNGWIDKETGFMSESIDNQIIWGWNGVGENANDRLSSLRGLTPAQTENIVDKSLGNGFNVNSGLLKYTSELLNATDGSIVDITRKIFMKDDNVEGFNGSGIWAAPSHSLKRFASQKGIRQHTMLDQYDRYAKAIRFDGNNVNGGNKNSVIYKTVMPRIHPTLNKEGKIDENSSKNLMFSIENLAIRVISKDSVGIIDDDMGSSIPVSEVGPFNGRIMWFPPYNIEVFETTAAKYESTVMVGRGEPIYNYQNSERSATLGFTLLIDYPPQLREALFKGTDKHKVISEFFAFGYDQSVDTKTPQPSQLKPTTNPIPSTTLPMDEIPNVPERTYVVHFPNDVPNSSEVPTVFDVMYKKWGYEIDNDCTSLDGVSTGLNKEFYKNYSLIADPTPNAQYHKRNMVDVSVGSQYSSNNDGFSSIFDSHLFEYFANEKFKKYYTIEIVGSASKLYLGTNEYQYNLDLGQRRANATQAFIESRLKAVLGDITGIEIKIIPISTGSAGQPPSTAGPTAKDINSDASKEARKATITIKKNSLPSEAKPVVLTPDDQKKRAGALTDNAVREENDYKGRKTMIDNVFTERGITDDQTKILQGFQSLESNIYVPVFHSQTPEEFHRRLVFLQQCMRQGNAQRKMDGSKLSISNSVFGRQPICILRIGDLFYTKVIIENLNIDYAETTWDMNPEGFGMQPMLAKVTLQMKIIGGQSLTGPIDALQNAVSFNYYANSTFTDKGMYYKPSHEANNQSSYISGILATERVNLQAAEKARYDNEQSTITAKPK